jgi:hypothetical protein
MNNNVSLMEKTDPEFVAYYILLGSDLQEVPFLYDELNRLIELSKFVEGEKDFLHLMHKARIEKGATTNKIFYILSRDDIKELCDICSKRLRKTLHRAEHLFHHDEYPYPKQRSWDGVDGITKQRYIDKIKYLESVWNLAQD